MALKIQLKSLNNEVEKVEALIKVWKAYKEKKMNEEIPEEDVLTSLKTLAYLYKNFSTGRRKELTDVEKKEIKTLEEISKVIYQKPLSPATILNRVLFYENKELRGLYQKFHPLVSFSVISKLLANKEKREKAINYMRKNPTPSEMKIFLKRLLNQNNNNVSNEVINILKNECAKLVKASNGLTEEEILDLADKVKNIRYEIHKMK